MSPPPILPPDLRCAVILPCHNEATAIAAVVADFRTALPGAQVFVYDNASTDETAEIACAAGAVVRQEPLKGKGHVIRRALAEIEADIYLMADG
ncbi:MAG: glycosyltransferase family 2 protein, partial [Desulfopila sp.]